MRRDAHELKSQGTQLGLVSLLAWGAIAAAFGLSLFYNQQYSQYLGLAGFGILGYLAVSAVGRVSQNRSLLIAAPLALCLVFWGWWLIAAQLSPVAYTSQATAWGLLALPAAAIASWWHSSVEPGFYRRLPVILTIGGCALAAFAIYQFFVLQGQPRATFINRNNFSALEVMVLVILIGSGFAADLARKKMRWPVLFYGAVALLVFVVGLAASRGALFALLCGSVLVLTGGWLLGVARARIGWVLLSILIGMVAASIVNSGALGQKIASLQSPFEVGSGGIRLIIWKSSIEMVEGNLWTGIGPGLYWLLYPRYRSPADPDGGFYVHNDYLQFLIEAGLPALVLFVALIGFVTWKTFRLVTDKRVSADVRMRSFAFWVALAAVAGHSFLSFNLYLVPILIISGLVLGSLCGLISPPVETPPVSRVRSYAWLALMVLIMIFPAAFYARATGAGFALSEAMAAQGEEGQSKATDSLRQAIDFWPDVDFYHYSLAWAIYTQAGGADVVLTPELSEEIFDHLKTAHRLNPIRARSFLIEGRVLESLSSQRIDVSGAQVVSAYLEALERNPRLLEARFFYARFLLGRNSIKEGVRVLESGLEWPYPTSVLKMNYYRLTAEMRKINGDMQGYDELMTQVRHIADALNRRETGRHKADRAGPILEF